MMSCFKASLIALALCSGATAASAQTINTAADIGSNFTSNHYAAVGVTAFPGSREEQRKHILQRLDAVCSSKMRDDQRRCDRAWRIIANGHAELQARRTAQAAAATSPAE